MSGTPRASNFIKLERRATKHCLRVPVEFELETYSIEYALFACILYALVVRHFPQCVKKYAGKSWARGLQAHQKGF